MAAQAWRRRRQPAGSRRPALRLHPFAASQWRSVRTTNAIERLHEEFKRRIKTQTVLPSADTGAMLFWALLASGQMTMRKVDGWQTLATNQSISRLTSPHDQIASSCWRSRRANPNHIPDGTLDEAGSSQYHGSARLRPKRSSLASHQNRAALLRLRSDRGCGRVGCEQFCSDSGRTKA
jgi:hypothetical protein